MRAYSALNSQISGRKRSTRREEDLRLRCGSGRSSPPEEAGSERKGSNRSMLARLGRLKVRKSLI